jgi:alkylhydroperoxidase family enzyme
MARVKLVFKPNDYPGTPDAQTKQALGELFEHMFPGQANPEIPGKSAAFATVARDPQLALRLIKLSDYILREMPWTSQRQALKQLAIQTLNMHFKCDFSFQSHLHPAKNAGISLEQQACLPFWRTANCFDEEQRLVIEYTLAVVSGEVPDELFNRVVKQYGEQGALEFTVGVSWWSLWAMIINATGTNHDFGYGKLSA